jgi:hypothetical protein
MTSRWLVVVVGLAFASVAPAGCKKKQDPGTGSAVAPAQDAATVAVTADAAPDEKPELPPPDVVPTEAPRRLWTNELMTEAAWLDFSKEQGGERFSKFVVDLKTDAVYYFDVDVYRLHKDFIFGELYKKPKTKEAVRIFDVNYGQNKTDFLMCYLVHHLAADKWTFAFWEGDYATAAHVEHAYRRMKATFWKGDVIAYRPDSNYQESVAKNLTSIPVLTNDKLYKDSPYAAFNKGKAIGTLRVVAAGAKEEDLSFGEDEIVILAESLPDITPVSGIISETFSTPLSHVSLRARAWGIPNVGLKGAAKTYEGLVGKTVYFEATDSTHTLREATAEEVAAWKEQQAKETEVILPAANLDAVELATLDTLRAKDVTAYGAKSANLGEIVFSKPEGFQVPPGFGVPIHWYDVHMKAAGLDQRVVAMLADEKFKKDATYRKKTLEQLRKDIAAAPLDAAFEAKLGAAVDALTGGDETIGLFVRSSTNAEDLPGFSGAGLSDTVHNAKGKAAVAKALREVWASVWNLRAYEEREHYRVDHTRVYGAVLIQVGVNATAAGVLVTVHPTDPAETVYTINAKSGLGLRVVEGKKVPETILYDYKNHGMRVLSRSDEETMLVFDGKGGVREVPNPHKGKPVLTNARILTLGKAARRLTKVFPPDRPLDLEWLFVNDDLYIVQSRPYNVRP